MKTIAVGCTLGLLLVLSPGAVATSDDLTAKELVEGMSDYLKKKEDDRVVTLLEILQQRFHFFVEDEQKMVVKAVGKCLNARRPEGANEVYKSSLAALGAMGEDGEKVTLKSLKNNNVKKRREVLAAALGSIAMHKNRRNIKTLEDFLVHSDGIVVAASAAALGVYAQEEEKVRKPVVEQLVKTYGNLSALAHSRPKEPVHRDKLNVVEKPILESLEKLTGLSYKTAPEWEKWYNNNKKKRWGS
jgi:hypothetical protein